MSKRELIEPTPGDKRYARRDDEGRFTEMDDVGRSSAQDQKRQAKTDAGRCALRLPSLELFEDQFLTAVRQAGSVVVDGDHHVAAVRICADLDSATGGCVLGGVFEEVDEHPLDQHRIESQQRKVGCQVYGDRPIPK